MLALYGSLRIRPENFFFAVASYTAMLGAQVMLIRELRRVAVGLQRPLAERGQGQKRGRGAQCRSRVKHNGAEKALRE